MNCIFEMGNVVPRGELYASYVDDLRHRYGALSGSVQTFTNIMRFFFNVFFHLFGTYFKVMKKIKKQIIAYKKYIQIDAGLS